MKIRFTGKIILIIIILSCPFKAMHGQTSRVDSVLQMLPEVRQENGIDTSKFVQATSLIDELTLADDDISQIEEFARELDRKDDRFLEYIVRHSILLSLVGNDNDKAISYGQSCLDELEQEKWPYSNWMRSAYLKTLRLPFRNSDRINDGFTYFSEKLVDAKSENDSVTLAACHYVLGGFYSIISLQDQAIYNMQKSISYMDTTIVSRHYFFRSSPIGRSTYMNNSHVLGLFYQQAKDYQKALDQFSFVISMCDSTFDMEPVSSKGAAETYLEMDSLAPVPELLEIARSRFPGDLTGSFPVVLNQIEAEYCIKKGDFERADSLLQAAWEEVRRENIPPSPFSGTVNPDYYLALSHQARSQYAKAIEFVEKDIKRVINLRGQLLVDYKLLAELNLQVGDGAKAAQAYRTYIDIQDDILTEQAAFRKSSFELEQEMNEREISIANLENENEVAGLTRNFTIGLAVLLFILALVVYNRYRTKQRDNNKLSETLSSLKSTQSQLIQSEKMASLGELTAGIAHEIQNPLNFVNNFSEVSRELIDEMEEEISNGNMEEVKELSKDIDANLEKITHHGKRADAIVKGMLAHSRSGKGEKKPTDLNRLAEEYLKLSYHGIRAKDKSFNADFKTDFDDNLPKVNVVPQDIGRVLLNLINNAFQAVNGVSNPTVTVKTKRTTNDELRITITDNGPGIPPDIKDKIFQPFFTTKPTGQGTGLGLSLSYDIVKAHGGELTVETEEGKGTSFLIRLPNQSV
ncbi:ATP-binding protein [Cryomorphaceae bacterium 1068]|nr:ATP-binding protein [Cryomorphaceae bacterium 1068]